PTHTGGPASVMVAASASCNWTAVSNAAFITITSGANGSGNGIVNYSVATNPGNNARSGTMTIAGQTFTVAQAGFNAISNPGFETGPAPWVLSGQALRVTGAFPHSGSANMFLAGVESSTGTAFQT